MENTLLEIAHTYGTPTFVFDEGAFQQRFREIHSIFGPKVDLCFAVKANPFLVGQAHEVAEKLEVCSPGELEICRAAGVNPGSVVFSGVNKTAESVAAAVEFGVGVLTAESLKHVALIEAEGARVGRVLDVLPRLNAGSQFGMSRANLLELVGNRAQYPHINLVGIHYFVGTQRKKLKHQAKELAMLEALIEELQREHSFTVQRLEYGPGLAVPLFTDDDFTNTLAPARELAPLLQSLASKVELTVEMGRFFATECGTYLSAVNDLKTNEDVNYCIVDGGINHLSYVGQVMGMKTPVITNLSTSERVGGESSYAESWCICGSLCTTNDVITRQAPFTHLNEGDVLAFHNAGAYAVTEGYALFLSRALPRVVLRCANGSLELARDFTDTHTLNRPFSA